MLDITKLEERIASQKRSLAFYEESLAQALDTDDHAEISYWIDEVKWAKTSLALRREVLRALSEQD